MVAIVGEIRMWAGSFAPAGWEFCNGQLVPISENEVLFTAIGTTYGGDGEETFALPNLKGRFPLHQGTGPGGITWSMGEMSGTEQETLTIQQIPLHTHPMTASNNFGQSQSPTGNFLARTSAGDAYQTDDSQGLGGMAAVTVSPVGGSQPHENMPPFLCISFIISMFGIFKPPQ